MEATMAFPSELPAMRRQAVPPPHPVATALAWAGMSYAIAIALLLVLLPRTVPMDALPAAAPVQAILGVVIAASVLPALIISLMARHAPPVWPVPQIVLPYLSILAVVAGLWLVGIRTDWFLESLALASR
jgi:hypothetical protein